MNAETITAAAQILAAAEYAIALTGAGLSVESGIPSFRGPDGLWTKYGQPSNLSYRVFSRDPQDWWEKRLSDEVTPGNPTYDLKEAVDNAQPNPGHVAIAELEEAGIIKAVITQNVDDLHGRAGSRNLLESTATATTCAASGADGGGHERSAPSPTYRRCALNAAGSSSWTR